MTAHPFEGVVLGTPDRPCTRCGLSDRHPIHQTQSEPPKDKDESMPEPPQVEPGAPASPPVTAEDEDICGETYDHDTVTTFEDDDGYQWECRRCGAEGWHDWEPA